MHTTTVPHLLPGKAFLLFLPVCSPIVVANANESVANQGGINATKIDTIINHAYSSSKLGQRYRKLRVRARLHNTEMQ